MKEKSTEEKVTEIRYVGVNRTCMSFIVLEELTVLDEMRSGCTDSRGNGDVRSLVGIFVSNLGCLVYGVECIQGGIVDVIKVAVA